MGCSPTFLGIGAMKAGTSTLHAYMARHPEIFVPVEKELHYFNRLAKGVVYPPGWYESHFDDSYRVRGEITPIYVNHLERIATAYPGIKVILSVRNPVERLRSEIHHLRRNPGDLSHAPDPKDIIENARSGQLRGPLHHGLYKRHVLLCERLGLPLLVIDFKDIVNNQGKVWRQICDFLCVNYWEPNDLLHYNASDHASKDSPFTEDQETFLKKVYEPSNKFIMERFGINLE